MDAATGRPLGQRLIGHTEAVYGVAFSPDGTRIASASTIIAGLAEAERGDTVDLGGFSRYAHDEDSG